MRTFKMIRLAAAAFATLWSITAHAATANCTVSVTPVSFGPYSPVSTTAVTAAGNVAVTCSKNGAGSTIVATYQVAMGPGNGGTYTPSRKMSGPVDTLVYQIYQDSGNTIVWGNTATDQLSSSMTLNGTASVTNNHPVNGLLPALQNVGVGSYSDTVSVTVSF